MIQYGKPALTTGQQVDLLIRRGMHIADRTKAQQHLTHISYYRLRAYWLPFEQAASNGNDHVFATGAAFATVLARSPLACRVRHGGGQIERGWTFKN